MSVLASIQKRARMVSVQVVAACLIAYFGYHIVQGDRGLFAWWRLNDQLVRSEATLGKLRLERQVMERRVALLRREHIDEDMLDEQVRRMLNLTSPNEVTIFNR